MTPAAGQDGAQIQRHRALALEFQGRHPRFAFQPSGVEERGGVGHKDADRLPSARGGNLQPLARNRPSEEHLVHGEPLCGVRGQGIAMHNLPGQKQ